MKKLLLASLLVFSAGTTSFAADNAIMPRVMLLLTEKNVGGYSTDQMELTVSQFLMDAGYPVIDTELVKTRIKRDQTLRNMTGSDKAAVALGLEFGADIVIVGRAIAKGSTAKIPNSNMRTYTATITAKAIRTDTAQLVATADGSGKVPHLDDTAGGDAAIKKAAGSAIEILHPRIMKKWKGASPESAVNSIQLVVADVEHVWQLATIRALLKEDIDGTEQVIQRSFISGAGTFDISTGHTTEKYAEQMVLLRDAPFKFKVVGITASRIDVKLAMK